MTTLIALFAAGILGGLLLGMIGVGMALIAVPVLTFALPHLGVPVALAPVVALATSMGIVTIGSVGSVVAHSRLGNVDCQWSGAWCRSACSASRSALSWWSGCRGWRCAVSLPRSWSSSGCGC